MYGPNKRKVTSSSGYGSVESSSTYQGMSIGGRRNRSHHGHHEMDHEKIFNAMEKGHKVCKLLLMKKWEPIHKRLSLNRETRQITLSKYEGTQGRAIKPQHLDIRLIQEVHTVHYKIHELKLGDKWKKDKEIQRFDPECLLAINYGSNFVLNYWIFLFENKESCKLWHQGLNAIKYENEHSSHAMHVDKWIRKQFYGIANPDTYTVTIKHMKPFVQTTLQYKVPSRLLQEISEGEMDLKMFVDAYRRLLNISELAIDRFSNYVSNDNRTVSFNDFYRFISENQGDEIAQNKEMFAEFLRKYLREYDPSRDVPEPWLTVDEFIEYLYSDENTIFNPENFKVVHDMTKPLTHYWIASSHNTYLTGDQLKSESSLDAYSRALLMGCRCIELDCWDGAKKGSNGEIADIVIYHGYTMTTKINLRDVLYTIRHYAFITSDYPVILSIEDNCSVQAQRLMAQEIKEILGDLLLIAPVSRDETQLPSPAALRKKIILKHKKLRVDSENIMGNDMDEDTQEQDILQKNCSKRGVLYMRDNTKHDWTKHVFVLFADRLCYVLDAVESMDENSSKEDQKDDSVSQGDEIQDEESSLSGFGVRPEEMHVTEEWFHGKIDRKVAEQRLLEQNDKGNGVFLVRDSNVFIGDYSLSFLHNERVYHCRIRTCMVDGEKKYYFLETTQKDTLYELISYYTKHSLATEKFRTHLVTPCPQPQPHLNQPWFSDKADKQRAEELLNTVREDGAFLIRYSGADKNVFVLSLRVDGEIWHYRLKRDGRIFVVNQTVFENLCQIVEFYSSRDFVRGICLKLPVNEKNVGQYTSSDFSATTPGTYMELKDLDKEIEALAIKAYQSNEKEALCFPVNAVISVIRKEPGGLWRGRYGSKTGFFPPEFVRELNASNGVDHGREDGPEYAEISLGGALIEKYDSDRPFAFRIALASSHWNVKEHILAADTIEEMQDWMNTIHSLTRDANKKMTNLRDLENRRRIAAELSALVVYCQATAFNPNFATEGTFYEMISFSENKHDKLLEKGLITYNARQLSRVYPQASRITSTNFNPVPMWNSACHMVALNYQTGDRSTQLNQGKFMSNGRCGYVLKPTYLLDETFKPHDPDTILGSCPILLRIEIIAGRNLARKDRTKGICSPFVEIEVVGLPCDSIVYRTDTATSNGLNPQWKQLFDFNVRAPEMAMLRFLVEDGDFVGPKTDPFIGQAVFPIDCIRGGFRSVPLLNQFSEPLELSSLLVYVDIRPLDDPNMIWLNPHTSLQAGRLQESYAGYGGSHTSSTRSMSMASNFSDRLSVGKRDSVLPSSPTLRSFTSNGSTRSESVDSDSSTSNGKSKKTLFQKLGFGKK